MRLLALLFLLAAPLAAQPVLTPFDGPPGGSADFLSVSAKAILLVQDGHLFRSADAGESWTLLYEASDLYVQTLGPEAYLVTAGSAQYSTLDGGVTWTPGVATLSRAQRAWQTPRDGWFVLDGGDLLRSTDDGATWTVASEGIGHPARPGGRCVGGFAVSPEGVPFLTTCHDDGTAKGAVYRWERTSEAWKRVVSLRGAGREVLFGGSGVAVARSEVYEEYSDPFGFLAIAAPPYGTWTDATDVRGRLLWVRALALFNGQFYAGGAGLAVSDDGLAWDTLVAGVGIDRLAAGAEGVYAASGRSWASIPGRGLFRYAEGTWQRLSPEEPTSRVVALRRVGSMLAAVTPQGVFEWHGGAWVEAAWQRVPQACYGSYGLFEATDLVPGPSGGWVVSVVERFVLLAKSAACVYVAQVELAGQTLFGAGYGLNRSDDGGATWQVVTGVEAETIRRGETGTLVAGGAKGLWRSADGGATWQEVSQVPVAVVENTGSRWEAVHTTYVPGQGRGTDTLVVVTSLDDGATWATRRFPLPEAFQSGTNLRLALGADSTAFVSTPNAVWQVGPQTIWPVYTESDVSRDPAYTPLALAVDAEGHLIIAPGSGGLLRTATPVEVEAADLQRETTLRAYPSPATSVVTLETGGARVEVFDGLGRRVATVEGAGPRLVLEVSGWPAGVYFARVAGSAAVPFVVAR